MISWALNTDLNSGAQVDGLIRELQLTQPITLYKQVQGLTLIEVPEGIVAHRNTLQQVHYLNHVAAMVLIMCDGKIPIDIMSFDYSKKKTSVLNIYQIVITNVFW